MKKAIAFVALVLLATSAYAQTTGAATILGTVTDTTGAVIPGAKVVVANTETGFKFEKSGLSAPDGVSGRGAVDCSDVRPNVTVCSGPGSRNAMASPG